MYNLQLSFTVQLLGLVGVLTFTSFSTLEEWITTAWITIFSAQEKFFDSWCIFFQMFSEIGERVGFLFGSCGPINHELEPMGQQGQINLSLDRVRAVNLQLGEQR